MSKKTCRHCDRVIVWGFVDYSDNEDWVHEDTEEQLCDPDSKSSPPADPELDQIPFHTA